MRGLRSLLDHRSGDTPFRGYSTAEVSVEGGHDALPVTKQ